MAVTMSLGTAIKRWLFHATLMRDMSLTCSGCTAAVRCRNDLDQGQARAHYGEYCPNAETLKELQDENVSKPTHA